MAMNIYPWKCKWCGQGDGALEPQQFHDRLHCLLCLRSESWESACGRNVKVEVIGAEHLKEGEAYALSADFFRGTQWMAKTP